MKVLLRSLKHAALLALLAVAAVPAHAAIDLVGDDTDLFTTNPNIPSSVPNVLIIIDNTSNWAAQNQNWPPIVDAECTAFLTNLGNQQGDAEICAIYKVSKKLGENVRVGIMMYAQAAAAGGYIRAPMLQMTAANKTDLQNILKNISTNNPGDKGPASMQPSNGFNDAFRYFNSLRTFTGVAAGSPGNLAPPTDATPPQADERGYTSTARTTYQFPAEANTNACGYDYIIFVGNGLPSKDASTWPSQMQEAAAILDSALTPNTNVVQNTGINPDVWSRFLYQYGVRVNSGVYRHVITHAIDVCKDQCDPTWARILQSMSKDVGGGIYRQGTDLDSIVKAFEDIFASIQAVNSVFAATTLPVSINVRGTSINQVYIGVFRPDAQLSPRWWGNLKQYRLARVSAQSTALQLVDANNAAAVNLNTGFFYNTATSIWSEATVSPDPGFWTFRGPNYPATDVGKDQDAPDGDLVEKGGAAQKIRQVYKFPDADAAQTRNIYTCTGTCTAGSTLKSFLFNDANTDITSTALGTFITQPVSSITASGQTATVTLPVAPSTPFVAGDQVVIAGAIPSLYNSAPGSFFSVLASPAPTATQFSYSVAPATPDTTRAYVNFPAGYVLTPGTDLVTVSGATPAGYNVTDAAISAVVGNVNQFSYALASPYPTSAATGYSVTGKRRIGAGNMVWNSGTNLVTVTLTNHGYTGGNVTVTGATPADFNVPNASGSGAITVTGANSFTFPLSTVPPGGTTTSAVATLASHGFGAGETVVITGASGNFNTVSSGSSLSNVTTDTFTYTTNGVVSGTATGTISAQRRVAADQNTFTVSAASIGTGSNQDKITLTIGAGSSLVSGQAIHTFVVGDKVAIRGVTCTPQGSGTRTCSTTTLDPPAVTDPVYTITLTAVGANSVTFSAGGNVSAVALSTAKVFWTGPTLSTPAKTLTGVVAGVATVSATGTIYVSQAGDLTSKISSIANQGVATGSITAARFGSSDAAERTALINWVRGVDNKDNENQNSDPTDIRASAHGDVLHSRPAVINYNRDGTDNDVFVFYGTNDGLLRAIKGGSLASGGGREQWTFVAPEFFGKLKRLRDQSPRISSLTPRDYFFDGSISVYTLDVNKDGKLKKSDNDKVYMFVTMRRGGRLISAFDISDPLDPVLMWKKGCREATGSGTTVGTGDCDAGFGEIGQTWGQPQLGYLRKWPTTLALIVGAGYDKAAEDFQPCVVTNWGATSVTAITNVALPTVMDAASCPPSGGTSVTVNRSQGRGVFILNAATGNILWRAGRAGSGATKEVTGMDYAIVGDIAALRNRSNTANRPTDIGNESVPSGFLDRLYATDTGGNVWRIDVADISDGADTGTAPSFPVTKLASIASAPSVAGYRKFMVQTDVVYTSDANGRFDAVLVGSGDREHVWDFIVNNRFYMFKDRTVGTLANEASAPATIGDSSTDLYVVTGCLQDASVCTASGTTQTAEQADLLAKKGWRLSLSNIGEKTIAPATTAAGTVIFNTHQPKEDTITGQTSDFCTAVLGTARQYGISYKDGTATNIFSSLPANMVNASGTAATIAGGSFLPPPGLTIVCTDEGCSQTVLSGPFSTNPGGLALQHRLRTYWFRKTD